MKFSELKKLAEKVDISSSNQSGHIKNLGLILDVMRSINNTLILDDVLQLVLNYAIQLSKTEKGFIVLINENQELEYKIGLDSSGNRLSKSIFSLSSTVVKNVFNSGESKFIERAQTDSNYDQSKSIMYLELQTILCSPLIVGSKKIGVLYVDSRQLTNVIGGEITNTFEILASQAAIAIRNAQLYNEQIIANESLQKANEQLIIAKEKAENSDKLKSNLLSNLSHEFRTPIHGIMGYVGLIKDDEDYSSREAMLNSISGLSKRLLLTLDEILQFSQVESNSINPNLKNINIDEIIRTLLKQYSEQAKNKGLDFKYLRLIWKPIIVHSDYYILTKALEYIIDNAIKFTKAGSVEIQVDKNNDKEFCEVKVIDTGIGIDKKDYEIIFQPFRQASEGMDRRYEGNGLGLTISKRIIELVGGSIQLESKVGLGSTFTISVPLTANISADKIDTKPKAKEVINFPKILLVEDNTENIQIVVKFLKDKYKVDSVTNGADAIKLAKQIKYDLVLMDINLKDALDGLEATRIIKSIDNYKDVPFIAVTGYALAGDQEKILEAGCDLYLAKPFTKNQLLEMIDSCFQII